MDRPAPPLVSAEDASCRVLYREIVRPFSLTIKPGEVWIVTGPNGSGKSIACELLAGARAPSGGSISWPAMPAGPARDAAVVSFERQERIMERERREDMSSIMHGVLDPGHRVRDLLATRLGVSEADAESLAQRFRLSHILDRGLRFLSTGEFRKTLLASAVASEPRLLVLDEPYDGLDAAARAELAATVETLHAGDRALVMVLNRRRDFPASATHVLEFRYGAVVYQGPFDAWPSGAADRLRPPASDTNPAGTDARAFAAKRPSRRDGGPPPGSMVVRMRGVTVAYGANPVLRDIDWEVDGGDRWMLHGPNGSGKSTLLSLVTGDNPKAYGQRIEIFGREKGTGESVWEIKRRIGMFSGDLQFRYPLRERVGETVLSGFYDSIGLFEQPSGHQEEIARSWIGRIGLAGEEETRLRALSFGQRRMVLVARAMVKRPRLLIADEPCQGLDDEHAEQVLALLDAIGREPDTCLLYVTHNADEALSCLTHSLELVPAPGGSRGIVTKVGSA